MNDQLPDPPADKPWFRVFQIDEDL